MDAMQAIMTIPKKRSASKNYDVGDLILPVPGPAITEELLLFTNLMNLTINSTDGGLRDLSILAKITTLNRLTIFGLSEANASIIEDLFKTPDLPLMTSLNRLTLSRNQLTELPSAIGQFTNVAKLILDSNQLTSLPEELSRLTNLQRLQVSSNCLTHVPDWIGRLSNLTTFKAHTNKLTTIPSQINLLTNVRELELSSNVLETMPDISMMHHLTYLELSSNQLEEINTAPNLEVLAVKGNKLSPDTLDGLNLPLLKELDLQDNNLTRFPDLHLLTALFKLNCFNNKLHEVPDDLSMLTSLRWLVIGQNSFKHLPKSVLKLTFLEHLSISKSKLQSVPSEISALQKLKSINIMSNPISVLPDTMCLLRKLQSFPKSASKFPPHFEFSQRTAEFLVVHRDLYYEEQE